MCIIVIKPANITFPSIETMETCFLNNPDGAGYMTTNNNKVHIRKGMMNFMAFEREYTKILKSNRIELPYIFHFRIGTHGKNDQGNTHPFAVQPSYSFMRKVNTLSNYGIAHNGIINNIGFNSIYSDTMEFVSNILSPLIKAKDSILDYPNNQIIKNILGNSNKLAFLHNSGRIETYGQYIEKDGLLFSNNSYSYTLPVFKKSYPCPFKKDCDNADYDCSHCVDYSHYDDIYGGYPK